MSEVRDNPASETTSASDDVRRRRPRWATPLAILLGAALLAVAGGGKWLSDRRAARRAAVAAANQEALQSLDERYEAMGEAAKACHEAANQLGVTMQAHLVVSEPQRTDAQLTADRQLQQTALATASHELLRAAGGSPPELLPFADEPVLRTHLERLAEIQRIARDHARQLMTLAASSEQWGTAIGNLRAEAQRYVDVANADRSTRGDPAALTTQWQRERAVLDRYRAAAVAAKDVQGLSEYSDAFLGYIDGSRAFIDEATALLRQGQIERYNQRLQEVFGVADPFGFNAAIATATGSALGSGLVLNLTQARNAATTLMDDIALARDDLALLMASRPMAG
ncbi:MAG: hypothetical protein ABR592_10405 [Nitriliruptorales bacterium]